MNTKRDLFMNARVLFTISNCGHCHQYHKFIERLNLNLPYDKRIKIVDATNYYEFNIDDDFLLKAFRNHIGGAFPVLFFEGTRIDGSNTRTETEAWLRARLHDDFIIKEPNPYIYSKDCEFIKSGRFKKKLVCQ